MFGADEPLLSLPVFVKGPVKLGLPPWTGNLHYLCVHFFGYSVNSSQPRWVGLERGEFQNIFRNSSIRFADSGC